MKPINAIAKVRFNSAKAQRVHLVEDFPLAGDLLCLESRQHLEVTGPAVLYAIAGAGALTGPGGTSDLTAGQLLAVDGISTLSNPSEQRLVCLAFHGS